MVDVVYVIAPGATFGVSFGLEVVNFDLGFLLFLCFVLHITFQLFVVSVVSSVVSVAPNSN
jgi:hypothetical protein